jgi:hypothetical protein
MAGGSPTVELPAAAMASSPAFGDAVVGVEAEEVDELDAGVFIGSRTSTPGAPLGYR